MSDFNELNAAAGRGDYVCPYCRREKSRTWTDVRDEEELLKREFVGSDVENNYYLDTKRKFRVRICDRCSRSLKLRGNIIFVLLGLMTVSGISGIGLLLINMFVKSTTLENIGAYFMLVSFGFFALLFVFWLLWKVVHRTRAHVSFDRAMKCNAIEPVKTFV